MDTTLSYLICLNCLPQTVHTSRDCAVLNVMGQYTVDQDTTAGCCAGRLQCFVDACRSCVAGMLTRVDVGAEAPTPALGKMAVAAIFARRVARSYSGKIHSLLLLLLFGLG